MSLTYILLSSASSIRQKLAILDELLRTLDSNAINLPKDSIPSQVLQLSCNIYLQEQGNLKQCRRLEKVLSLITKAYQCQITVISLIASLQYDNFNDIFFMQLLYKLSSFNQAEFDRLFLMEMNKLINKNWVSNVNIIQ